VIPHVKVGNYFAEKRVSYMIDKRKAIKANQMFKRRFKMKVYTRNSVYNVVSAVDKGGLNVLRCTCESGTLSGSSFLCLAVFPDRIPMIMSAQKVVNECEYVAGYNKKGTRCFKFIPSQIKKGMVLFNRGGFKTTPIEKVWEVSK
jgi:hypothetical protein